MGDKKAYYDLPEDLRDMMASPVFVSTDVPEGFIYNFSDLSELARDTMRDMLDGQIFAPQPILDSLPKPPPPTRWQLIRRRARGYWLWLKYLPLNAVHRLYGIGDDEDGDW